MEYRPTLALAAALLLAACGSGGAGDDVSVAPSGGPEKGRPVVVLDTSLGAITIELDPEKAPGTVENFLRYVDDGFYDGTVFHRVVPGFVVQGGGYTEDGALKQTRPAIQNEAENGLKNERGTLSMARTQAVHSATSQFFINLVDNEFLDHGERDFGYAVFARVTDGMDVVDAIAKGGSRSGKPDEPVVIRSARRKEAGA